MAIKLTELISVIEESAKKKGISKEELSAETHFLKGDNWIITKSKYIRHQENNFFLRTEALYPPKVSLFDINKKDNKKEPPEPICVRFSLCISQKQTSYQFGKVGVEYLQKRKSLVFGYNASDKTTKPLTDLKERLTRNRAYVTQAQYPTKRAPKREIDFILNAYLTLKSL